MNGFSINSYILYTSIRERLFLLRLFVNGFSINSYILLHIFVCGVAALGLKRCVRGGRRVGEVRVAAGELKRCAGRGVARGRTDLDPRSRWSHPRPVGRVDLIVDSIVDSIVSPIVDSIANTSVN